LSTITDVARRAGVSPATVSRVINDVPNVNPATRARVGQAIRDLAYVPNVVARSLRSKRTSSLALLVPDITNGFWTTVARGVEDAALRRGYSVFLCNTDENLAKQQRYLSLVTSQRADGIIIAPCDSDAANLSALRGRDLPTVVIDRRVEGWDVDSVTGDSFSGARALVGHLRQLGHERIAMFSGPSHTSTAEDRVAGYCAALEESGIAPDVRLIRRGEFRASSGEQLTNELLDEGLCPTAIFAANNAVAVGVIEALGKRGRRIPNDVAVVCFDDLPNLSQLFPFLTVVVQPAYDMGINAAQLLLSRLDSEVPLKARHVVLPARLIVRYSCGSQLPAAARAAGEAAVEGQAAAAADPHGALSGFSLPLRRADGERSILVKPAQAGGNRDSYARLNGLDARAVAGNRPDSHYDRPDVTRLLRAFQHQEADRLPHLEFWVTSKAVYEYVLAHELKYDIADARVGGQTIAPEDHVEFARRLGMDAVACNFSWRPNNVFARAADGTEHYVDGTVKSPVDLESLERPVPLTDQLSYLERYLRAAQGTGVGVFANFTSFFDSAMLAIGVTDALYMFHDNRAFVERLMDILLMHQEQVVRAVCDRFAQDLAFVLINDDVAYNAGLMIRPEMFMEIFPHRMRRLIAPAKEHGKLLAMHSDGKMDHLLPILHELGFHAVHPIEPECNDIFALKEKWAGKLAFVGNIPTVLLAYGNKAEIEQEVKEYCSRLAPGGGYVLGSSTSIMDGIPPENFVAMVEAVHKYGRYDALRAQRTM